MRADHGIGAEDNFQARSFERLAEKISAERERSCL